MYEVDVDFGIPAMLRDPAEFPKPNILGLICFDPTAADTSYLFLAPVMNKDDIEPFVGSFLADCVVDGAG